MFSRPSDSSSRSTSRTTTTTTTGSASTTTTTPTTATASVTATTPTNTTTIGTPQAPKRTNGSKSTTDESSGGSGGGGGSSGTGSSKVLLSELQNYLSGLKTSDTAGSGNSRNIDLSTALNADAVASIDAERTEALMTHLPTIESEDPAKKQLKDTILSPQFQQALSMFSSALQSGQLGPVVSQFQLTSEAVAAASSGDLEQFVKALEKTAGVAASGTAATGESTGSKASGGGGGTTTVIPAVATEIKEEKDTPMDEDKPE